MLPTTYCGVAAIEGHCIFGPAYLDSGFTPIKRFMSGPMRSISPGASIPAFLSARCNNPAATLSALLTCIATPLGGGPLLNISSGSGSLISAPEPSKALRNVVASSSAYSLASESPLQYENATFAPRKGDGAPRRNGARKSLIAFACSGVTVRQDSCCSSLAVRCNASAKRDSASAACVFADTISFSNESASRRAPCARLSAFDADLLASPALSRAVFACHAAFVARSLIEPITLPATVFDLTTQTSSKTRAATSTRVDIFKIASLRFSSRSLLPVLYHLGLKSAAYSPKQAAATINEKKYSPRSHQESALDSAETSDAVRIILTHKRRENGALWICIVSLSCLFVVKLISLFADKTPNNRQ